MCRNSESLCKKKYWRVYERYKLVLEVTLLIVTISIKIPSNKRVKMGTTQKEFSD